MKFAFGSDLHLEFGQLENLKTDADILLLAGDIVVADDVRSAKNPASTKYTERYDEFFDMCSSEYEFTYYIMGNHEYYHSVYQHAIEKVRNILPKNVILLDDDFVDIDGLRLFGTTLWTDCNMGSYECAYALIHGMNDFRVIKWKDRNIRGHERFRRMIPSDTTAMHYRSLMWLEKNMTDNALVMSHHAPSWGSVHPQYASEIQSNGGYASNLDEFIMEHQPKLWIHGHMHDPVDYMIGDTRVISNPRGYIGHEPKASNFEIKVIEV